MSGSALTYIGICSKPLISNTVFGCGLLCFARSSFSAERRMVHVFSPAGAGSTKRLQFLKDGGAEGEVDGRGQIISRQTPLRAIRIPPTPRAFLRGGSFAGPWREPARLRNRFAKPAQRRDRAVGVGGGWMRHPFSSQRFLETGAGFAHVGKCRSKKRAGREVGPSLTLQTLSNGN